MKVSTIDQRPIRHMRWYSHVRTRGHVLPVGTGIIIAQGPTCFGTAMVLVTSGARPPTVGHYGPKIPGRKLRNSPVRARETTFISTNASVA
jgi:hypothetical protein